jgi:hypothetical protein
VAAAPPVSLADTEGTLAFGDEGRRRGRPCTRGRWRRCGSCPRRHREKEMGQPVGRRVLRAHRGPLLRALASLTASLLAAPRPPSQRRNVGALVRRLSLLSALLHLEGGGGDAANLYLHDRYVRRIVCRWLTVEGGLYVHIDTSRWD